MRSSAGRSDITCLFNDVHVYLRYHGFWSAVTTTISSHIKYRRHVGIRKTHYLHPTQSHEPRCNLPGRDLASGNRTPLITPTPNLYLPRPLRHIDPTRSVGHTDSEQSHTHHSSVSTHNGKVGRIASAAYSSDEHVSLVGDCC